MFNRACLVSYLLVFSEIVLELKLIGIRQIEALATNYNVNTSYPIYTTTVERVATFSNGCYKQRIIEPDLWNSKRFYETEQLVCPPAVNASTFTMLTQQLQLNSSTTNHTKHYPPVNNTSFAILPHTDVVPAKNFINIQPNVTYVPQVTAAKTSPAVLMPAPAVSQASYPTNPTLNYQPLYIPAMVATNATSHTAILSKKTGFFGHDRKTSSAKTINNSSNCFYVFIVILVTIFFEL